MKSEVWLMFTCAQVQQESSCTPITDFAESTAFRPHLTQLRIYSNYTALLLLTDFGVTTDREREGVIKAAVKLSGSTYSKCPPGAIITVQ